MAVYRNKTLALKPADMDAFEAMLDHLGLSFAAWVRQQVAAARGRR